MYALHASVAEEGRIERGSFVYILAQRLYTICVILRVYYPVLTILEVYQNIKLYLANPVVPGQYSITMIRLAEYHHLRVLHCTGGKL